jgi:hypothetical protein
MQGALLTHDHRWDFPQPKRKRAALAGGRFDASAPAHTFDARLNNDQVDARADLLVAIEPPKLPGDLTWIVRHYANAAIFHPFADKFGFFFRPQPHDWWPIHRDE